MDSQIWESRYYELERTLEHMVRGFGRTLEKAESSPASNLALLRVTTVDDEGTKRVCAVANGENMEYSFEFRRSGEVVSRREFNRLNSAAVPATADKCIVVVRSFAVQPPATTEREVAL